MESDRFFYGENMSTYHIDGIVGLDTDERDLRAFLAENPGDVKIEISSPGGFVYDGLGMFNQIRNHSGRTHTHLIGLAASMASYLAMAGDTVTAEDNAVFMIHNPFTVELGDYREMEKTADVLKRLASLLGKAYSQKTGKLESEIKELMDAESYFFGDEIIENGFVDEVIKYQGGNDTTKDDALALAQVAIQDCRSKMQAHSEKENFTKAVAILGNIQKPANVVTSFDDESDIVDRIWESAEADRRVRQHTDSQDGPDNSGPRRKQYRDYFSWYDPDNAENFGAYKLPIADVSGGRKIINIRAVRNALARLGQTQGPSPEDKARIKGILQRYVEKNRQKEGDSMDVKTLKTEHRDVYDEILNMGIADGQKKELSRVKAHIKMGQQAGAMDYAIECIAEGRSFTNQEVQAEYMAKALKTREVKAREEDNPPDTPQEPDAVDEKEAYAKLLEDVMGRSKRTGKTKMEG